MPWEYLILTLLLIFAAYTVIPDFFPHRIGIGSWKRQFSPGVALTFDDGPDAEFTPKVLEILEHYQIKATFFLVWEKAAQYPEIVHQIIAKGHQIGAHSKKHQHGWLISPIKTWQEWSKCISNLERLTGARIEWIRPPWGTFNLSLIIWVIANKKKAVLWNAEGHDWEDRRSPEQITERILRNIKEGSIILLHDSGKNKMALQNSLTALNNLCQKIITEYKLPIVPLEFPQWTRWRFYLFSLWEKWEHYYAKSHGVNRIDAFNVFGLTQRKYKGPNLYDDEELLLAKTGDIVGDLHLRNSYFLAKESNINKIGFRALRHIRESMPALAEYAASNPDYKDINVFIGLTLLHRGATGLGFHVQDIPASRSLRLIAMSQKMIMRVYHPLGKRRSNTRLGSKPKLVWISKRELVDRWLPQYDGISSDEIHLQTDTF